MSIKFPRTGLYAITQTEGKTAAQIIAEVTAAIKGGAVVVQYRDKNPHHAIALASALLTVCHDHFIPLIINDDIELAAAIGADGVHLGQYDGDIEQARYRLGSNAIIGLSCYNDVTPAIAAEKKGANYVAFGRFFPSSSKPLASPAQVSTLIEAKNLLSVPIVAIGGILPENGKQLLRAGADLLAVIGGVFNQEVETSARAYQVLFGKE
jgi:thiamine-phosphate pyrophosphorylase